MLGPQVQQFPRLPLRIALFEVREQGGVGEMLEARGIVSHDVVLSWEVRD